MKEKLTDAIIRMKKIGRLYTSTVQEYGADHGRIYLPKRLRDSFNIKPEKRVFMDFRPFKKYMSLIVLKPVYESQEGRFGSVIFDKQGRLIIENCILKAVGLELFKKAYIEYYGVGLYIWGPEAWKKYNKSNMFHTIIDAFKDAPPVEKSKVYKYGNQVFINLLLGREPYDYLKKK